MLYQEHSKDRGMQLAKEGGLMCGFSAMPGNPKPGTLGPQGVRKAIAFLLLGSRVKGFNWFRGLRGLRV